MHRNKGSVLKSTFCYDSRPLYIDGKVLIVTPHVVITRTSPTPTPATPSPNYWEANQLIAQAIRAAQVNDYVQFKQIEYNEGQFLNYVRIRIYSSLPLKVVDFQVCVDSLNPGDPLASLCKRKLWTNPVHCANVCMWVTISITVIITR